MNSIQFNSIPRRPNLTGIRRRVTRNLAVFPVGEGERVREKECEKERESEKENENSLPSKAEFVRNRGIPRHGRRPRRRCDDVAERKGARAGGAGKSGRN